MSSMFSSDNGTPPTISADGQDYLDRYPGVAASDWYADKPYDHYLDHGKGEGLTWGKAKPTCKMFFRLPPG